MDKYEKELQQLNETLAEKLREKEALVLKRKIRQQEFHAAQTIIQTAANPARKIKQGVRAAGAYLLRRRNPKQLYSKTYKRKNAQNRLKKYTYHLYELGFTEKALGDLKKLYKETDDRYLKRAIAWELSLWYANKYTEDGAKQALDFLPTAIRGEKNEDFLRRAVIIAAECLERLGKTETAKRLLLGRISVEAHPDLYLAMANLQEALSACMHWINRALNMYQIAPISLSGAAYEDLATRSSESAIEEGPKVSVIIPAYRAADSIHVSLDSILSQTWKNIEVLVVDDCSPDHTADVVRKYAQKDQRVNLLTTPENSGPYVARNIALTQATGEFVTINDADDWSHAEKIATQVRHLIDNEAVIANTSEHARLTEELKLHRRGTPGTYIFSNMSSLMFRREPISEKIGYWDTVRFAADSEFKRRITAVFGAGNVKDLNTGPLSFPRQASGSLTGSSAFGYKGFLMGVRREYAEVHRLHHREADSLYYPFPQGERPYPAPEPMLTKTDGQRNFDIVIAADFRLPADKLQGTLKEILIQRQSGLKTGLVQMARYDFTMAKEINSSVREIIDGEKVQMLVYGEQISCDALMIKDASLLEEKQKYIPDIKARTVRIIFDKAPVNVRQASRNAHVYFDKQAKWHPLNEEVRNRLSRNEQKNMKLSSENWHDRDYTSRLEDWVIRPPKGDGDNA